MITKLIGSILTPRIKKAINVWRFPDGYVLKNYNVAKKYSFEYNSMATNHNHDFMFDKLFMDSYKLGDATGSWRGGEIFWRAYIYFWAANQTKHLEGDFVECGVHKGGYAIGAINYIDFISLNKKFFLFDTYQGLSKEHLTDKEKKEGVFEKYESFYPGDYYEEVKKRFSNYKNVEVIKGTVPETFSQVSINKVCFLSIDMNCTPPERATLEYFWDKLVSGAIIVLDDHGFVAHKEQKMSNDEFAKSKGLEVLILPTGQGVIIKP